MLSGRAVERLRQRRDRGFVGGVIRPRHADRRHLPCANLPENFLPHLRMLAHILRDHRVERQATPFHAIVVTGDAIAIDEVERRGGR